MARAEAQGTQRAGLVPTTIPLVKPGVYIQADTHAEPPYEGPVEVVLMGDMLNGPHFIPKPGQSYKDAVLEALDAAQETMRNLIESGAILPLDPFTWDPPLSLLEDDLRRSLKSLGSGLPKGPRQP